MKKQLEARVVAEQQADGKTEVFLHDPHNNRTVKTGLKVASAEVEREIAKAKEAMERAGHRVTVVERELR